MFSVKDLLISHGYKQSKSPTNSSKDPGNGNQHDDTARQSGQVSRNGLSIHPGAIPKNNKARRSQNEDKSDPNVQGKPKNCYYENFSGPGNVQGEVCDQSQQSSSSHTKDFGYRRRQCQYFSALDRVDYKTRGMASASTSFKDENKSQWDSERLETMRSNQQETMNPSGNCRSHSLKAWKQPTVFGQCEPDTDNKERPFQDMYVQNKSQSFPRFLLPDNSNYAEILSVASGKQYKVKPEFHSLKHSKPATRPKYGRPLKPPSYEFHQQSRGVVETNLPQDEQQKQKTIFHVTKGDDSGQHANLEPPLYIPPPSYKSPGEQSDKQFQKVPNYSKCFVKKMQSVKQNIYIPSESSLNQIQMEDEQSTSHSKKLSCQEKSLPSVQYIPFNDPRIRHIQVLHPGNYQMEDQSDDTNNTSVFYKNAVDHESKNTDAEISDSINIAVKGNQVPSSSRWLGESDADQDSCALSTQRSSHDADNDQIFEYPKPWPSAQSPGAIEYSSEITKVKTFESGTEIQGKNHLKKKTNETMFCLVSVPLQSEMKMQSYDKNNSEAQGVSEKEEPLSYRDLKEQSFLSTSSSDLELQALSGNMININVSEKQDFQMPELKQKHDLSYKQPPKHKELVYSGSWPCNRNKDQETQTSFIEESPKICQPLHGSKQLLPTSQLKKPNTLTNGHFLKYGSPSTESALSKIPTDNRKDRPIPPPRKTQFNKPSKIVCPKVVVKPKTGQNESDILAPTGLPVWKNEPSFAQKKERKSPCRTKEAFGQFLLKPVGRRPWDAISELECFNKEIQKQEERNEDDKEKEQKQETEEEKKVKKAEDKACRADEVSQNPESNAEAIKVKPVFSMFKKETNKTTSAYENASRILDAKAVFSDFTREKKRNIGLNQKQSNAKRVIKLAISLPLMKSGCSANENSKPFNRETSAENHNKDSDKLKNAAGRYTPASETASVAPLSFKRVNPGRSVPNLRSVGLDVNEGTSIPDSSAKKIPSNESLHSRASRILGIEVPVESLTADGKTRPDEDSDSDNMARSNELSNKKSSRAEMKTNMAASKGKPKSGWSKSTFIGEDILGSSVSDHCSDEEKLTHVSKCFQQHPDLRKRQEGHAHSPGSAAPPLDERRSLPSNIEKKTKSTSQVTLTRQGKVVSAASRAAMDRIARMKEVVSVSRMRRLSIKDAYSGESRYEDKEAEKKRSEAAIDHTKVPRKLSQVSCVSKHIISLNENERIGNRNTKQSGKDLPSSEVYDPSQVERV